MTRSRIVAAAALLSLAWLATTALDSAAALSGWLFAITACGTIVIGALLQAMISYLTGATWFAVLRRYNWMIVAATWAMVILALPLLLGMRVLYPWISDRAGRSAWLTPGWFAVRTVLYLATWTWLAERLLRVIRHQDRGDVGEIVASARTLRRISAGGAIAVAVTLTFAGFDWVMSRDPAWTSTIFGVYLFAGGYLAALALIALLACVSPAGSLLNGAVSAHQRAALATMIFMAAILWGYIAFSQFLIIWIGDIPADAHWYLVRGQGGWRTLGYAVLLLEFALPFALLLFRRVKAHRGALGAIAAAVIVGHILDSYWTIGPTRGGGISAGWRGALALAAVATAMAAAAIGRHRELNALPQGDPDLEAAIAYRRP